MSELDVRLERELMKPENFPQRFKFARLRADETHTSLGKQTGMSDAASWQWEAGNNMPSPQGLGKAAKVLGVNVAWLKSGVGEMLAARGDPGTPKLAEKFNGTTGPDGMDLTGRLRFAREKSELSMPEIAKKVGMGASSIGFHFTEMDSTNYRKPSAELIRKYARVFQVKELWLESGIGKVSWDRKPERGLQQRLTDCAIRAGLESRGIGKKLHTGKGTFSKHSTLTGANCPPSEMLLVAYAKLFGVPLKWLATGEGEPPFEMHPFDIQAFRRNIREYCHVRTLTNAELSAKVGIHPGTFSSYITTESYARPPKPVTVGRMAKALGVNFDWLYSGVGEMDNSEAPPPPTLESLEAKSEKTTELSDEESPAAELPDDMVDIVLPEVTTVDKMVAIGHEAPAKPYTEILDEPQTELAVPSNSLQATSLKLTDLIAERDEYRGLADATQVEIDRWTAVLMNQVIQ